MALTNTLTFFISYDLGIDGDYEGIYSWLDKFGAKECGDSVARIKSYKFSGDFANYLKRDIKKNVKLRIKDRIYIIFNSNEKLISGFIFGSRKAAPWTGYHQDHNSDWDDI